MAQTETIQENFFQAIDTIVQSRIANLPYDKTFECKVIDISKASQRIYKVEYQNVQFEATTDLKNLAIDDIVFVSVPQGDFRKDKIITALKKKSDTQYVKTLPFLNFIKGDNLFSIVQQTSEFSIKVNSNKEADRQFFFTQFYGKDLAYGFTKMGIKTSIRTNINTPLIAGDFGIKILVRGYDQKEFTTNNSAGLLSESRNHPEDARYAKEFTLTRADMVGTNLYNTHGYQNQEKVFDITGWVIDNIVVTLWQDNKFTDTNGVEISDKFITFTGLSLTFGYGKNEFDLTNDTVEFYTRIRTKDGFLYTAPTNEDDRIYKEIEVYALSIDTENNKYLDISHKVSGFYISSEWYDPDKQAYSLYSKRYGFESNLTLSGMGWFNVPLTETSNSVHVHTLNPNGVFEDPIKCGYLYLIFNADALAAAQQNGNVSLFQYHPSNALWFVDETRKDLLEELYKEGVTEENEDITLISGQLICNGTEVLFKSNEGRILLRLNTNGAQLNGNAATASDYQENGNIYKNLKSIETAIRALGGNYTVE